MTTDTDNTSKMISCNNEEPMNADWPKNKFFEVYGNMFTELQKERHGCDIDLINELKNRFNKISSQLNWEKIISDNFKFELSSSEYLHIFDVVEELIIPSIVNDKTTYINCENLLKAIENLENISRKFQLGKDTPYENEFSGGLWGRWNLILFEGQDLSEWAKYYLWRAGLTISGSRVYLGEDPDFDESYHNCGFERFTKPYDLVDWDKFSLLPLKTDENLRAKFFRAMLVCLRVMSKKEFCGFKPYQVNYYTYSLPGSKEPVYIDADNYLVPFFKDYYKS